MNTKELIDEISDLPEERWVEIAKHVIKNLDPSDPEVDKAWLK